MTASGSSWSETLSEGLSGRYVDVYDFPHGHLEVRTKGLLLPYRVFSKDQRVSHTAVVENKRLGHALAIIKAQQDTHLKPKVNTNSEKNGYQERGRNIYGPDYIQLTPPLAVGLGSREQYREGNEVAADTNRLSEQLAGQQNSLNEFSVRPLDERKFEKNQEPNVAEIIRNKRLGKALAAAERIQALGLPPKVQSKSGTLGDMKRGRQSYGPDYLEVPVTRCAP